MLFASLCSFMNELNFATGI